MTNKILLNDNIISVSAQRGIARYFNKIVDGTIAEFSNDAIICSPQRRDYGSAKQAPSIRFPGSWRVGLQDKIATLVNTLVNPKIAYSVYYGEMKTQAAQVFTVYDMMHEMFAPPNHPFIAQKRRCLQRASALLAISENTAKDIVAIYPDIDPQKIIVTPLGVDPFFFGTDSQGVTDNSPYFLYVGHRTPYKNFMRLLEAFGQSGLAKEFDLKIISPRSSNYTPEEINCIETYHLERSLHLLTSPSDAVLRKCYTNAFAFVYPSIYEGFGLPLLEAMASGTLVAVSNTSSMPEVGGQAAYYFDPHSTESIAACLQQISNLSTDERAFRIKQGIAQARLFTWKRCLRRTMDVFHQLVSA